MKETETRWIPLRCGPLHLYFDPETAGLRRIRLGDREIVRAIYAAVRDRNWDTVTPRITDLHIRNDHDGFQLSFHAQCSAREIAFSWSGTIAGKPDGSLEFRMEGTAQSTFWRNRIGFCVLHPIRECAGQPCSVTLEDGTTLQAAFPDAISPHQPFQNMRAIAHEALPGVIAEVSFEGDIFEMEDQRNWTDASFKTYCTPLALPYPVEVRVGTKIVQSVTLTLRGEPPPSLSLRPHAVEVQAPVALQFADKEPLPPAQVGLGIASHGRRLSEREITRLQVLALSHLRLDLRVSEPDWEAKLCQASEEARAIVVRLEIAVFLTENAEAELGDLAQAIERLHPPVLRWLVFRADGMTPEERGLQMARRQIASLTPGTQIGSGTDSYFAELNRQRPPLDSLDCVCYAINPQVHAFDTATLVENLEAQGETVRSARQFCGNLPIIVSPVTLKPRFNPNATQSEAPPLPGEFPSQVDPRQCTLFGAGWTLGSLKSLCESGAQSITYYETTGWRGIMEEEAGTILPERFPSTPGAVFPMYYVFAHLAEFAGGTVLPLESTDSLRVQGLALQSGNHHAILCANLTSASQSLRIQVPAQLANVNLWQMEEGREETFQDTHPQCLATSASNSGGMAEGPTAKYFSPSHSAKSTRLLPVINGVVELELPTFAYARLSWEEDGNE